MKRIIIIIVLALALAATTVFAQQPTYIQPTPIPEPVVELTVKQKIQKEFSDAPIMVHIADAESDFVATAKNTESSASGVFQILRSTWTSNNCKGDFETQRFDEDLNIACARVLYDRYGTSPWNPSKHSWGRFL